MISDLVMHEGFVAAWANHLDHLHEVFDLLLDFLESGILSAFRAAHQHLTSGAFRAKEDLAVDVSAFLTIIEHHASATGTQE